MRASLKILKMLLNWFDNLLYRVVLLLKYSWKENISFDLADYWKNLKHFDCGNLVMNRRQIWGMCSGSCVCCENTSCCEHNASMPIYKIKKTLKRLIHFYYYLFLFSNAVKLIFYHWNEAHWTDNNEI